MTFKMSICYENSPSLSFDMEYFLEKHIPLVKSQFSLHGLHKLEVNVLQLGFQGEEPRYHAITEMYFEDLNAIKSCMKAAGGEVGRDVKNYTNAKPFSFISKVID